MRNNETLTAEMTPVSVENKQDDSIWISGGREGQKEAEIRIHHGSQCFM